MSEVILKNADRLKFGDMFSGTGMKYGHGSKTLAYCPWPSSPALIW